MAAFPTILIAARERAGITQAGLAEGIGVSTATMASWETGRRRPGASARQQVIEAADWLHIEAVDLNLMLEELGFSPVPAGRTVPLLDRRKTLAVIQAECETYPWPVLAMNEDFEVVAWNAAANDLSELDFGVDLAEPGARHLLRMALSDHYNQRLLNWDEVIGVMIGMWKTNGFDPVASGDRTPYFDNLMNYVVMHHAAELGKLLGLWQTTEPWTEGNRALFRPRWRTSDGTLLNFHSQLIAWSDFDGVTAFDWQPADATTWEWLDARRKARLEREPSAQVQRELSNARELLRFARERNGLTRKQVAARSGLSESTLYAMEAGKRPLVRETIVSATRAMKLDMAFTNAVLDAAGFDPEPSDLTAYILGYELSAESRFAGNLEKRTSWEPAAVVREVASYPWPALVVNARCEVIAINVLASDVFGVDLTSVPPGPARNLFTLVTDAAFMRRTTNWEVVIANVLPGNLEAYMARPDGELGDPKDAAYFESVVQFVRRREVAAGRGDAVIRKVFDAWRAKPDRRLTARITFPFACGPAGGALNFNTVIGPWNGMMDPYWAIELHPADAETWRRIS